MEASNKSYFKSNLSEVIDVKVLDVPGLEVGNEALLGLVDGLGDDGNLTLDGLEACVGSTVGLL